MNFCSFPPPKAAPSSLPPSTGYTLLLIVFPLLVSLLLTTLILLATLLLFFIILSACNVLVIYAIGSVYLLQLYVPCPYSPNGGVPLRPPIPAEGPGLTNKFGAPGVKESCAHQRNEISKPIIAESFMGGAQIKADSPHVFVEINAVAQLEKEISLLKSMQQNHTKNLMPYRNGKISTRTNTNRISILGPYPGSPLYNSPATKNNTKPFLTPIYTSKSHPNKSYSKPTQITQRKEEMTLITQEDEELIQKFIGLSTENQVGPVLRLPHEAASTTDWSTTLVVRVVTNRTVLDGPFVNVMRSVWQVDGETKISPIAKGAFMVQCLTKGDMEKVLMGGPWSYRGDIVAVKRAIGHADLSPESVNTVEAWVQLYNIPLNSINEEGVRLLGEQLGPMVAAPAEGFTGGRRFVKVKVVLNIGDSVKDRVKAKHPTLGEIVAHCHFEKISRICIFCGLMGHEISDCCDHLRLSRLMHSPEMRSRPNMSNLLKPKWGKWISDLSAIPKPNLVGLNGPTKRSFEQTKAHGPATVWQIEGISNEPFNGIVDMDDSTEEAHYLLAKKAKPTGHIPSALDI